MPSFQHLHQLREYGLSFSGILVYAYLKEHGVLHGVRDGKTVDLLSFPIKPTTGLAGSFAVSSEVKMGKPYHFVKYWRKGGAFHGSNYYGQSKPRDLKIPR